MDRLIAESAFGEKYLVAYLDLCGTEDAYSKLSLNWQIERIYQVVSEIRAEVANRFTEEERKDIYIHMFGDSVVIAEKEKGKLANVSALIELLLNVQYAILQDSASNEYQIVSERAVTKKLYMPTLSRALVRRGSYYGAVFSDFQQSIENVHSNFSLVGGLAILEMDKDLRGLPMGTYVESSIIEELNLHPSRILDVVGVDGRFKFVKPSTMPQSITVDFNEMMKQLVVMSGHDVNVISKLTPWVDAIVGQRNAIVRRIVKKGVHS